MYLSIQWLGGSDWELWVFIFPVESEAKELPRLFQPHTIYIYIYIVIIVMIRLILIVIIVLIIRVILPIIRNGNDI